MEWLIATGTISLIMGAVLLFSDQALRLLGTFLNRPVAFIDKAVNAVRTPAGIVLVIVGGWIVSVAFNYPELWFLHLLGIIILFFGLLYLFLPQWLEILSRTADQFLFSTDELVLGTRKSLGVILIVVAIYIFYAAYLAAR